MASGNEQRRESATQMTQCARPSLRSRSDGDKSLGKVLDLNPAATRSGAVSDATIRWDLVLALRTRLLCGAYTAEAGELAGIFWARPAKVAQLLGEILPAEE